MSRRWWELQATLNAQSCLNCGRESVRAWLSAKSRPSATVPMRLTKVSKQDYTGKINAWNNVCNRVEKPAPQINHTIIPTLGTYCDVRNGFQIEACCNKIHLYLNECQKMYRVHIVQCRFVMTPRFRESDWVLQRKAINGFVRIMILCSIAHF